MTLLRLETVKEKQDASKRAAEIENELAKNEPFNEELAKVLTGSGVYGK